MTEISKPLFHMTRGRETPPQCRSLKLGLLAAAAIISVPATAMADGDIALLGALPNAPLNASGPATGVNADGTVAVGASVAADVTNTIAYRWTATGGMATLGTLAGDDNSRALGVSGDGKVAVGFSVNAASFRTTFVTANHAFRWTQTGGMVNLGALAGDNSSQANATSFDGGVVVGTSSNSDLTHPHVEGWRWTQAGGLVGMGFFANGGVSSTATGVSSDGSVIVGKSARPLFTHAYRWTAAGGMVDIGTLGNQASSFANSEATYVSGDGATVVGNANVGLHLEAWRWTATGGMVSLTALGASNSSFDSSASSTAAGVSADGSVIVFNVN
jgi:probable HAF family extracellular repeat protein